MTPHPREGLHSCEAVGALCTMKSPEGRTAGAGMRRMGRLRDDMHARHAADAHYGMPCGVRALRENDGDRTAFNAD